MNRQSQPKIFSYVTYYPYRYFWSNPVIWKIHFLWFSILWIGLCLAGMLILLLLAGTQEKILKVLGYGTGLLVFSWLFSWLLFRERRTDLHQGRSPQDSGGGDGTMACLEFWPDRLIYRCGLDQWIIMGNLENMKESGKWGWKITLADGAKFWMPCDLLTDFESAQLESRVALDVQLDLNREKIRKALECHKMRE